MTFAAAAILAGVLAVLVGVSWHRGERLGALERKLADDARVELAYRLLAEHRVTAGGPSDDPAAAVRALADGGGYASPRTARRLARAAAVLSTAEGGDLGARRAEALRLLGEALREEGAARRGMLRALRRDTERALGAALAVALTLSLLGVAVWARLRRRVLHPLVELDTALGLLARRDFRPLDPSPVARAIRPLFEGYNRMARRIRGLEEARVKREAALRRELECTTRALVKQQALLARADRLAASRDLAARVAHRLRSPLSAVLVTLTNLREETDFPDHRERLRRCIVALQRSFHDLTAMVEEARQEPETAVPLVLRKLVDELLLLHAHQVDDRSRVLENEVPPDLVCSLPAAGTRHALMSLLATVLEAGAAPGGRRVRVSAERAEQELRIAVQDDGRGFTERELHLGLDGAGDRRDGGLGLAIVRCFVDHLGGALVLENAPGGGARGTLIIPQGDTHG
jgi:signal transduction histidine kinase